MENGHSNVPRLELVPMNEALKKTRRKLAWLRKWRSSEATACGVLAVICTIFAALGILAALWALYAIAHGPLVIIAPLGLLTVACGKLMIRCGKDFFQSVKDFREAAPSPELLAEAESEAESERALSSLNVRITKLNAMVGTALADPDKIDPRYFRFLAKEWELLSETRSKAMRLLQPSKTDP